MTRQTWDETWLAVADVMAGRSRCERGAGAVIVDARNQVCGTGYTGPPAGYFLTISQIGDDCRAYCRRASMRPQDRSLAYTDCPSAHAEMNAAATAVRRPDGGTFCISSVPCLACAKTIANIGVTRALWRVMPALEKGRDVGLVTDFFDKCGIEWEAVK